MTRFQGGETIGQVLVLSIAAIVASRQKLREQHQFTAREERDDQSELDL